jgi:hypothetical protein
MRRPWASIQVVLVGLLLSSTIAGRQGADTEPLFTADAAWLKLPEGRTQIGSMHGDVAVSAAGEVYISVEGSVMQRFAILGPSPGLQVYAQDGTFLRNVPGAPFDLHGFLIRREAAGEFLYGVRLAGGQTEADQTREGLDRQAIVKMSLDGKILLAIPASSIPDQFKNKSQAGRPFLRLTGIAVAPNGDIYVTDGYASSYIHRFDRDGKYLKSFGGRAEPYGFRTLHKLAIDPRFQPARLIACDRENMRVVYLSLEGDVLGVTGNLLRPAAVAIFGDYAAVGEIRGRVSLLDTSGKAVAVLGENTVEEEIAVNRTEPARWRPGILTAPHGVAFNERGDLFVSEFNLFGRVHRFNGHVRRSAIQE